MDFSTIPSIGALVFAASIVVILVWLILRWFNCWYWKINRRVEQNDVIIAKLERLSKNMDSLSYALNRTLDKQEQGILARETSNVSYLLNRIPNIISGYVFCLFKFEIYTSIPISWTDSWPTSKPIPLMLAKQMRNKLQVGMLWGYFLQLLWGGKIVTS